MDPAAVRDIVEWAITTRRSVRGFTAEPVPYETVARILEVSARAPSGTNVQPWKAHVVTGPALARLKAALSAEHAAGVPGALSTPTIQRRGARPTWNAGARSAGTFTRSPA